MQVVSKKRTRRSKRRRFRCLHGFTRFGLGAKFAAIEMVLPAFPGGPSFQRITAERTLHNRASHSLTTERYEAIKVPL